MNIESVKNNKTGEYGEYGETVEIYETGDNDESGENNVGLDRLFRSKQIFNYFLIWILISMNVLIFDRCLGYLSAIGGEGEQKWCLSSVEFLQE